MASRTPRHHLWVSFDTFTTGLLAIIAFSLYWDWRIAPVLVVLLYIHEVGHLLAAHWRGVPVLSAPIFVPGLGSYLRLGEIDDAWDDAVIFLAGPLLGAASSLAVWAVGWSWGLPPLSFAGAAGAVFNCLLLLPFPLLDGGRIISRTGWPALLPAALLVLAGLALPWLEPTLWSLNTPPASGPIDPYRIPLHQVLPTLVLIFAVSYGPMLALFGGLSLWQGIVMVRRWPHAPWSTRLAVLGVYALALAGLVAVLGALRPLDNLDWRLIRLGGWLRPYSEILFILAFIASHQSVKHGHILRVWLGQTALALRLPVLRWLAWRIGRLAEAGSVRVAGLAALGHDWALRHGRWAADTWLEDVAPALRRAGPAAVAETFAVLFWRGEARYAWLARWLADVDPSVLSWRHAEFLAMSLVALDRASEALPVARAAMTAAETEADWARASARATLGMALLAAGAVAEAESELWTAAALHEDASIRIGLARALAAGGKYAQAVLQAETAVTRHARPWPAHYPSEDRVAAWLTEWRTAMTSTNEPRED